MCKHIKLIGFLFILILAFNSTAHAGMTFGAKMGPMVIDSSAVKDDPTNAGVAVGYELGVVLGDLGVEGEFTTTVDAGNLKGVGGDVEIDTVGLYATYRTPGFIYFKGRGGFVSWEIDGGDDDTTTSMGIGLGFSLKLIKFELDYTKIDDDIDFVSLGVQF